MSILRDALIKSDARRYGPRTHEITETLGVPKTFFRDHAWTRDIRSPEIVEERKTTYLIDGTTTGINFELLQELLNDAEFYSAHPEYPAGLRSSARATVKRVAAHLEA